MLSNLKVLSDVGSAPQFRFHASFHSPSTIGLVVITVVVVVVVVVIVLVVLIIIVFIFLMVRIYSF